MASLLPLSLNAGQSVSYNVTFTPQMSGATSANLAFASNAATSVVTEALSGTGAAAPTHSVDLSWDASFGGRGLQRVPREPNFGSVHQDQFHARCDNHVHRHERAGWIYVLLRGNVGRRSGHGERFLCGSVGFDPYSIVSERVRARRASASFFGVKRKFCQMKYRHYTNKRSGAPLPTFW